MNKNIRVGFIATRLSGTDGVSLETAKWVRILAHLGHDSHFFTAESEWPEDRTYLLPEAHFIHPDIVKINEDLFDNFNRSDETSRRIHQLTQHIKGHLEKFNRLFKPDLLIAENVLSLPMNVPLGLALTEFIIETGLPTIGHHHDFSWERSRFARSGADDFLRAAFPPTARQIRHVVINSYGQQQLALRTGVSSKLIPNVMDFDRPPSKPNDYVSDLRVNLGVEKDDFLLLQPTRIVPRKRIELAIEFARRLELPCTLVISHGSGDEGKTYEEYLREYSRLLGVKVRFAADRFSTRRKFTENGEKIYSLADAYQASDLVTYPSIVEGFGNAFLESIYYQRPIVMSMYEIFYTDIEPKGFKIIGFNSFIDQDCIHRARSVLLNPERAREMTSLNFQIAQKHYSFDMLQNQLSALLTECFGMG